MVLHHHVRSVTDSAVEQKTAEHTFVTFTAVLLIWVGFALSLTPTASSTSLPGCRDSSTKELS